MASVKTEVKAKQSQSGALSGTAKLYENPRERDVLLKALAKLEKQGEK